VWGPGLGLLGRYGLGLGTAAAGRGRAELAGSWPDGKFHEHLAKLAPGSPAYAQALQRQGWDAPEERIRCPTWVRQRQAAS
jgi:hypothetical protein